MKIAVRLLRDTLLQFSWAGLGWAGQGSSVQLWNNMRQEYFLNRPIQRGRDFGGQ